MICSDYIFKLCGPRNAIYALLWFSLTPHLGGLGPCAHHAIRIPGKRVKTYYSFLLGGNRCCFSCPGIPSPGCVLPHRMPLRQIVHHWNMPRYHAWSCLQLVDSRNLHQLPSVHVFQRSSMVYSVSSSLCSQLPAAGEVASDGTSCLSGSHDHWNSFPLHNLGVPPDGQEEKNQAHRKVVQTRALTEKLQPHVPR